MSQGGEEAIARGDESALAVSHLPKDGPAGPAKTLAKRAVGSLPSESSSSRALRSVAEAAHRNEEPAEIGRLLSLGADPNEVFQGLSALHWKAGNDRNAEPIELLVAAGADPNARAEQTLASPLHFACLYAHERVVEKLLENGADPNSEDHRRQTPFHYLALGDVRGESVLRVASALFDAGVDPFAKNVDKKTAFDLAQSEWFRAKVGEEVAARMGKNALPRESSSGVEDATDAAIKAVDDGDLDALTAALNAGADPSSGALFRRLIQRGRIDLLKVVFDAGTDLDRVNISYGIAEHTPLEFAATNADPDVLEFIAEASNDRAFVQRSGDRCLITPVMAALENVEDWPVNLQIVLDAGKKRGVWERELGSDVLKEAAVEATFRDLSLGLEMLLDAGADPNWADGEGSPLLAIAAERGNVKCVVALLKAGADPWAKDARGRRCWEAPGRKSGGNLVKRAALKKMSTTELPSE